MIVDKINSYLASNGKAVAASILEDVGALAAHAFSRQFGERVDKGGSLRLSSIGRCTRQQTYSLLNFPVNGKEIDARAKMVFFMGDLVELAIIQLARQAGCNITACGLNQGTVQIDGVYGHPDGVLHEADADYLVEVKSMSSYAFGEFERGVIDEGYQYQYNAYLEATGFQRVCVVALNKDAGVLAEQVRTKDSAIVADISKRIKILKSSTKESLPERPFRPNDKGFYPWNCLYCAFHKTCLPEAEKVLVRNAYKLKAKEKANEAA